MYTFKNNYQLYLQADKTDSVSIT